MIDLAFARLDQSVDEFRRVRQECAEFGVSWVMAVPQLEMLVPRFPERTRQILDAIERPPAAGNDPDAMPPVCPSCLHTVCSGDCSTCGSCRRAGPLRMSS